MKLGEINYPLPPLNLCELFLAFVRYRMIICHIGLYMSPCVPKYYISHPFKDQKLEKCSEQFLPSSLFSGLC